MKAILLILGLLATALAAHCRDLQAIARAVSNSVYISSGMVGGSGTVFVRTNSAQERIAVILTAGHVIAAGGSTNLWTAYWPLTRTNGFSLLAKPLGHAFKAPTDLGVLLVIGAFPTNLCGAQAKLSGQVLQGEEIFAVGCPYGPAHINSVDVGTLAHLYRRVEGILTFQISCVVYPGSSGGGVYTSDGLWIGSMACIKQPGLSFAVPIYTCMLWLNENRLGWVLDPAQTVPTQRELLNRLSK